MIICIISAVLFVVGVTLSILFDKLDDNASFGDDSFKIAFYHMLPLSILGFIGLCCAGFGGLSKNTTLAQTKLSIELTERVESINSSKKSLEKKIESSTYTVLEINDYNNSVRDYKTEVAKAHVTLNNPWINWFECCAYKNFDVDAVSYLFVE